MGGSAVGGRWRARPRRPASRAGAGAPRGYALPPWTAPDTLVLCSSYSGDTEETLACYDAAGASARRARRGHHRRRAGRAARAERRAGDPAPGGFQPRAAVGYSIVAALEVAALCGAGAALRAEVDVAAAQVERSPPSGAPTAAEDSEAKALARALHGTVPVIAGAGLTAPVAYRWKCQFNENAKLPAFAGELPELDHNEIVGWDAAPRARALPAVFLEDSDAHPRVAPRIELTRELIEAGGGRRRASSQRAARRRSSGCSRSCCSATSSRSTSRCCAARTRRRSSRSTA